MLPHAAGSAAPAAAARRGHCALPLLLPLRCCCRCRWPLPLLLPLLLPLPLSLPLAAAAVAAAALLLPPPVKWRCAALRRAALKSSVGPKWAHFEISLDPDSKYSGTGFC